MREQSANPVRSERCGRPTPCGRRRVRRFNRSLLRRVDLPLLLLVIGTLVLIGGCRRGAEAPGPPSAAGAPETADHRDGAGESDLSTARDSQRSSPKAPESVAPASPPPDAGDCANAACHGELARRPFVHAPLADGTCASCHGNEEPGHQFPLAQPDPQLCLRCHDTFGLKGHTHAPLSRNGCLVCHDPHSSHAPNLLAAGGVELTCLGCHALDRKAVLHGPFALGECTACHDPHESDHPNLLRGGDKDEHCFLCHGESREHWQTAASFHEPMKQGCSGCHLPHTSDHAGLLETPVEDLCFSCHADVQRTVTSAAAPHGAVMTERKCAHCHDPHAAPGEFLLRKGTKEICLSCHDRPLQALDGMTIPDMRPVLERSFPHGPVESGQCTACHDVHGGRSKRLLHEQFPESFYGSFELRVYALCFQCHDADLVTQERTATATGFRTGDRNLHFVHVNREAKGRTCRTCHEIHGSDLPRHMASEVPFESGGWTLPIRFEKTDTGGRCSPGCHQPYDYDRTRAMPNIGARPAPESPAAGEDEGGPE